jgi:ATP-dependent Clp protease ATP-binding subunit ClpA
MGARPFVRLFESKVKKPLSKEILFGTLKDGGRIVVDLIDGEIKVDTHPLVPTFTVV